MRVVVPNPQAVIYLPLLLRTRRELKGNHNVEFYTLDVASRSFVPLTKVANLLMEKWKKTQRRPTNSEMFMPSASLPPSRQL